MFIYKWFSLLGHRFRHLQLLTFHGSFPIIMIRENVATIPVFLFVCLEDSELYWSYVCPQADVRRGEKHSQDWAPEILIGRHLQRAEEQASV